MAFKIEEFLRLQEVGVATDAVLDEARMLKQRLNLAKKHFKVGNLKEGTELLAFFFSHLRVLSSNMRSLAGMMTSLRQNVARLIDEESIDQVDATFEASRLEVRQLDEPSLSDLVKHETTGGEIGRPQGAIDRVGPARPGSAHEERGAEADSSPEPDVVLGKGRVRRLLGL